MKKTKKKQKTSHRDKFPFLVAFRSKPLEENHGLGILDTSINLYVQVSSPSRSIIGVLIFYRSSSPYSYLLSLSMNEFEHNRFVKY